MKCSSAQQWLGSRLRGSRAAERAVPTSGPSDGAERDVAERDLASCLASWRVFQIGLGRSLLEVFGGSMSIGSKPSMSIAAPLHIGKPYQAKSLQFRT